MDGAVPLKIGYDALGRRVETTTGVEVCAGVLALEADSGSPGGGDRTAGLRGGEPEPQVTRHVYAGLKAIQDYAVDGESVSLAREFVWGRSRHKPGRLRWTERVTAGFVYYRCLPTTN